MLLLTMIGAAMQDPKEFSPILTFGLVFGLIGMELFGGLPVIQHIFLRIMLYFSGAISRDYVSFLDYCAGCILLRKVGGGYIFTHRLLMEYLASLEISKLKEKSEVQSE